MKDKDYTVNIDRQSGYINTEIKYRTEYATQCMICGNQIYFYDTYRVPRVCNDCKNAIAYAKKLMEKDNER